MGEISTPFRSKQSYTAGERLQYATFDMKFIVSENMENYIELYNWMKNNSEEDSYKTADIILHILSSNNNTTRKVRFLDAFPVNMCSIDFHTQNTDVEYLYIDASFRYTLFEFMT